MKQDPGASEFFLQSKDHAMIHLKGAEAEQVISLLLQNLPEDRTKWEDVLKQRLSSELKLQDGSPEWKLDVKWKDGGPVPAAVQAGAHGAKDTVQEKAKDEGKAKGKEKEKEKQDEKDKGKGKGHEDEDD
ncbi:hypothetical protein LJK88_49580 [Paenibacillus sp. P26]|nr:hypothetical protein LJK88_49580 [Paenibacillus sp. P26]